MKLRKTHAAWAIKIWVMATVFILIFLSPLQLLAWLAVGGVLGLIWRALPEEPEAPVERLPYQDEYDGRQVPRREE
jgi:hypothetical protein